jgi:pimeloyl-ACP methyl ester carboxylesterase
MIAAASDADEVKDQRLRLPDRRRLGFRVYGDPKGLPVLFLHGTPGSRLKFSIAHDTGRSQDLAIVAPDRWGYGLTEAPKVPSLRAFADDMAALMDRLGDERFAVGGISGGGPYAATVAACLGQRITAVALVSPVGPIADIGLGPVAPLPAERGPPVGVGAPCRRARLAGLRGWRRRRRPFSPLAGQAKGLDRSRPRLRLAPRVDAGIRPLRRRNVSLPLIPH